MQSLKIRPFTKLLITIPLPFGKRRQVCASFLQGSSLLLLSRGKRTVLNGLHWVQNGICRALTGRPVWKEPHKQRSVPNLVMLRIQKRKKTGRLEKNNSLILKWHPTGISRYARCSEEQNSAESISFNMHPLGSRTPQQHIWLGSCPAPRAQSSGEGTQNSHQQS